MALPKGYIRSNDEVAEPFQPLPTQEKWTKQDLWDNRRGTVIRSGLYLKYRREQSIEIDVIRENIQTEIEERKAADKSLNDRVDKVEEEIANMDDWHEPLAQETAARIAGDKKLTDDLNTEINTRASQTAALQDKIAKEISDRTVADTVLDNRINKEIQDRADADEVLQSHIDAETQARESADQILQNNIDAEAIARADGDKKNSDAVNALKSSLGTAAFVNTGNQPGNVPVIQDDGVLSSSIIPPVKVNHTWVVDSESEMLALNAAVGDFAVRTDTSVTYVLKDLPASNIDNWILLSSPTDGVTSWNGQTGAVTYKAPVTSVNGKKDDVVITVNGQTSGADGNIGLAGEVLPVTYSDTKTIKDALDETVHKAGAETITGSKTYEAMQIFKTTVGSGLQSALGVILRDASASDIQRQTLLWMNPTLTNQTANGFTFGIGMGANAILGGGESARSLLTALADPATTPPAIGSINGGSEHAMLIADSNVYIGSGYQSGGTTGSWWTFTNAGKFLAPDGSEYVTKTDVDLSNYVTLDTEQTILGTKTFGEIKTTGKGEDGQTTALSEDGLITTVQKVAGSAEYSEIQTGYGTVAVRKYQEDGTPLETALLTSHGVALSTDRGYTPLTMNGVWLSNYARVKVKNGVMVVHISGAHPSKPIDGTTDGNIKTVAKLPQYFVDLLKGLDENVEFMWSNYGGGQLTYAGRIDVTGEVRLYIMPTSASIVTNNRFSCYVPIIL